MTWPLNPARVDFVTLRLFCAVVQTGSITQGAAACHLALSAASRRLSDFEETTGFQLLERTSKGVTLTPVGHMAMQHAMRLFQGFERFSAELQDHSRGLLGHVRLWANMSALTEFLPARLATFLAQHAGVHVEVEEQLSGDIARALVDGLADIGVFSEGTPTDGLDISDFQTDTLVLLCSRRHPLARKRRVDFASCLEYDMVGLNRGSALLELTSRAAEQAGRPLRLRIQVRSFDAMCQMIAADLGVGVLPQAVCRAQAKALGLHMVGLSDDWASRRLLLATRSGVPLSTAARLLGEHLRQAGVP
ncbi:LysR family transcriptional regulator [Cupriavidus basilensis]|uniref:LysR family transcriptional regulator n=1 Tax=Cupriavidus basilensis TaxID=68895 RepID=UPI0028473FF6|nr:LysR family transcriptional regulator [Cupriavidus basilensis]MDR3385043.1 LysR family transcriptional regulator [Cupriavidus basilensis]